MSELLQEVRAALAGQYAIDSEIGRGGMAVVYLATDQKHERAVAVKVLLPDLASSLGADRFLREIRVAAKLSHPNILPLYDSGSAGGLLYYSMPYVDGESLRQRIRREGPLALDDAVEITRQVAGALAYAHARGFVHRDVKPENILLAGEFALVTDFGIARALSVAGGEHLTRSGLAVGTPYYMSPEQAMGDERLSGRSDQYSLGCVLYELLAGGPPFVGPTPQAVLKRHSLDPVPPLRTVRSSTPPWLEAVVMRALAKVPAERFDSMDAFGSALVAGTVSVPGALEPPGEGDATGGREAQTGAEKPAGLGAGTGTEPTGRSSLFERVREALEPRYELESRVDAGGMAIVFRARDKSLQRAVAVKVLRPELATAAAAERLMREARTLAGFSHPNLVPIHEVGEKDGLYFYVMDFVDGETLEARLKRGPLDRDEVRALGRDLLTALEAVHEAGVIHRDVKPGNIFLVSGRALLSDFGIAKHVDTPGEVLTRTGHIAGTPAYMAPEQASGQPVTVQTDLYAAGLVLYEVLTGRRWTPFADPERADWTRVPPRMERSLRRALELDPADRWSDAAEFRASLEAGEPTWRATRRWTMAAGGLVIAIVAATVLFLGRRVSPPLLDLALFPCEPIGVDSSTARDLSLALAHNLSNIPGLSVASARTSFNLFDSRAGDVDPEDWRRRLRAREAVRCVVTERDGLLRVEMDLFDARGHVRRREGVEAPVQEPPLAAADSAALRIVQTTGAPSLSREALLSLSGYSFDAVKLFLAGEEAFHRGAHAAADSFYGNALDLDSTLTVARWRLAEVRRWRAHSPIEVDLQTLYRLDATALSRLDSLLLDARVQPYGLEQLDRYRAVLEDDAYRYDAYATLLYADELFHRGGLWGIPIDSGVAMLDRAVRRDSFLVPAVEHLTLARIRLNQRAEAEMLLRHLRRVHPRLGEGADVPYPDAWQHVYVERFDTVNAESSLDGLLGLSPDRIGLLALGSRYVRYADAPNAQIRLGRRLVAAAGPEAAYASLGHVAQGLGRISQGQILAGFAHFDSVAARNGSPEAELQAAEWRVVPFVLGLEGFPEEEARNGGASLARLWERSSLAASTRVRVAWTLALLATRVGSGSEASLWAARVDSLREEADGARLSRLLRAHRQALSGRYDLALAETDVDLAYDSAGLASRPFARSALYLSRGDWFRGRYEDAGGAEDLMRATESWYWHENTDLEMTEPHLIQAAEVDGALGGWARVRTVRAAKRASPRHPPGLLCSRSRDVLRLWKDPDPPLLPLVEEMRQERAEAGCEP